MRLLPTAAPLLQAEMNDLRGRVGRAVPGANYLEGAAPPDLSGEADLKALREQIQADEAVAAKRRAAEKAGDPDMKRIDAAVPTREMRLELIASGVSMALDEEQIFTLSRLFNERLEESLAQTRLESRAFHRGHGSWMNLFSEMDVDKVRVPAPPPLPAARPPQAKHDLVSPPPPAPRSAL